MSRNKQAIAGEVLGLGAIGVGLWWVYPPLALIVVGIGVILGAQLLSRANQ